MPTAYSQKSSIFEMCGGDSSAGPNILIHWSEKHGFVCTCIFSLVDGIRYNNMILCQVTKQYVSWHIDWNYETFLMHISTFDYSKGLFYDFNIVYFEF